MTAKLIRVQIFGLPVTEGSTEFKGTNRAGKPIITHHNHESLAAWRNRITGTTVLAAQRAGWSLRIDEPVECGTVFYLPRPKRPRWEIPATKPDLDKLVRAVGDALAPRKGVGVLREDSRIFRWSPMEKCYASPADVGVVVTVRRFPEYMPGEEA